ncbi:2-dehydropantoate 2-reductase [Alkalihalobacillus sp. 1P02AB]|uniref:2-dehydropantoate 2-reductase n=1 Tax=Alkalihalobacillus sp. 1P02AB TaxID=3132260 RepID=UPI0039A53480
MNVTIVGAGSIGLLIAAFSSKVGHNVTLITKRESQAQILNEKGLIFKTKQGVIDKYHIKAISVKGIETIRADCVIFAVKSYHLKRVLDHFQGTIQSKAVLFVQNGMAHIEYLSLFNDEEIGLAVVEHGAMRLEDNFVSHTGVGRMNWSTFQGSKSGSVLTNFFSGNVDVSFPFYYEKDWQKMLQTKLLVNVAINPLTALLQVKNGALLTNDSYYKLMSEIVRETVQVLGMNYKQGLEKVTEVCQITKENESSMLRDRTKGQKTELEAIVGYVVRKAYEQSQSVPSLFFLYEAIKGIEQQSLRGSSQ